MLCSSRCGMLNQCIVCLLLSLYVKYCRYCGCLLCVCLCVSVSLTLSRSLCLSLSLCVCVCVCVCAYEGIVCAETLIQPLMFSQCRIKPRPKANDATCQHHLVQEMKVLYAHNFTLSWCCAIVTPSVLNFTWNISHVRPVGSEKCVTPH